MSTTPLPKTPGIYAIINVANHHCYVGSSVDLRKRFQYHFGDLLRGVHVNAHLQHAYTLYGAAVFIFVILEHVPRKEDLVAREQHYMDLLKPEYNIAPVAGNSLGVVRTPEFKAKLSAINKGKISPNRGKKMSDEQKAKMSAARLGKPGKVPTAEHRAKISAANSGKKRSDEQRSRISAAKKGCVAHNRGKKMSDEQQAKLLTPEAIAKREATKRANRLARQQVRQLPLF